MRPIDADHLTQIVCGATILPDGFKDVFRKLVAGEPTVDRPTRSQFKRMAVQLGYEKVVRCQNCAKWQRYTKVNRDFGHCEKHDCMMKYDDFCSRPERKTDEKV